MSKHNYSQYSKSNKTKNNYNETKPEHNSTEIKMEYDRDETTVSFGNVCVEPVIESVETVALPETVIGTVAGCNKLNIRSKPAIDADVLVVVDAGSKVEIDPARSTSDWLKVTTTAGVNGYCMRRFVDAKL